MKDALITIGICVVVGVLFVCFIWGLLTVSDHLNANYAKEAETKCSSLAKQLGIEEYKVVSYECALVKDGKIVEVE